MQDFLRNETLTETILLPEVGRRAAVKKAKLDWRDFCGTKIL